MEMESLNSGPNWNFAASTEDGDEGRPASNGGGAIELETSPARGVAAGGAAHENSGDVEEGALATKDYDPWGRFKDDDGRPEDDEDDEPRPDGAGGPVVLPRATRLMAEYGETSLPPPLPTRGAEGGGSWTSSSRRKRGMIALVACASVLMILLLASVPRHHRRRATGQAASGHESGHVSVHASGQGAQAVQHCEDDLAFVLPDGRTCETFVAHVGRPALHEARCGHPAGNGGPGRVRDYCRKSCGTCGGEGSAISTAEPAAAAAATMATVATVASSKPAATEAPPAPSEEGDDSGGAPAGTAEGNAGAASNTELAQTAATEAETTATTIVTPATTAADKTVTKGNVGATTAGTTTPTTTTAATKAMETAVAEVLPPPVAAPAQKPPSGCDDDPSFVLPDGRTCETFVAHVGRPALHEARCGHPAGMAQDGGKEMTVADFCRGSCGKCATP